MKNHNRKAKKSLLDRFKKHPGKPHGRFIFDLFLLVLGIVILFVALVLFWVNTLKLPSFNDFEARKVANSTRIYDRTGTVVLYNFHANIKRTVVPFDQISPYIKESVISIEDDQFYNHNGIRITSIIRSVFKTATGSTQGGSTITQQVVKNSLLSPEKTIIRKVKEWILALKLERNLSKDEILGIYLNESPFGGTIYGVEEASLSFFGKSAKDVTLAEAAYLAALPQAPSRLSPYGKRRADLDSRKNLVLSRMSVLGYITPEEYTAAKNEVVNFQPQSQSGGKALHFIFYVRQYLEDTYGEDTVENGGLRVISTLDWELQQKAESVVKEYALKNSVTYDAENAGLVAIDSRTGDILSMVGSRDYFDDKIDGKVNITLAKRQPGSSFKPIVYGTAFEKGYTPETVLFDVPTEFNVNCPVVVTNASPRSCYNPVNYDGAYRGPVSLRNSLAQSLNVPAVKLLYLTGVNDALDQARKMGITTLADKNQYGLTLVLGGGEVTLLELTSAYTSFANNGSHPDKNSILSITDNTGKILEEKKEVQTEVFSRETASRVNSILSDNVARTPAFGAASPLHFGGRPVAVKTGTTNDYHDVWTVGYTPSITVGVWGGNNNNRPIAKKAAGSVISPMWRAFMDQYFILRPEVEYFEPVASSADNPNPILRGVWCSPNSPIHDILFYIDKNKPREYNPGQTSDPQFNLWEGALDLYKGDYACPFGADDLGQVPEIGRVVEVVSSSNPVPGSEINIPFSVLGIPTAPVDLRELVNISISSTAPINKVEYDLGGTPLGAPSTYPFSVTFSADRVGASVGQKNLNLRVFTPNGFSYKSYPITIK